MVSGEDKARVAVVCSTVFLSLVFIFFKLFICKIKWLFVFLKITPDLPILAWQVWVLFLRPVPQRDLTGILFGISFIFATFADACLELASDPTNRRALELGVALFFVQHVLNIIALTIRRPAYDPANRLNVNQQATVPLLSSQNDNNVVPAPRSEYLPAIPLALLPPLASWAIIIFLAAGPSSLRCSDMTPAPLFDLIIGGAYFLFICIAVWRAAVLVIDYYRPVKHGPYYSQAHEGRTFGLLLTVGYVLFLISDSFILINRAICHIGSQVGYETWIIPGTSGIISPNTESIVPPTAEFSSLTPLPEPCRGSPPLVQTLILSTYFLGLSLMAVSVPRARWGGNLF